MEQKFANIIVNISHEALDKSFQYKIPSRLDGIIRVGDLVSIPFGRGNRTINGYVLEITDKPEYDPAKQKEVINIITDASLVENNLIRLALWMKENYGSTMITALKTVLPIKKKIKEKEDRTVFLKLPMDMAKSQLDEYKRKNRTARHRLLQELINDERIDYKLVTGKLNISAATLRLMEEAGIIGIENKRVYRNTVSGIKEQKKTALNQYQKPIADSIIKDLSDGIKNTYLIKGITGSGKTEIYMEIIEHVISQGKQVIVLIPEISLTYQTVMRFYRRFGERVSTLHSKLSDGEKYDQFERAKRGEIDIIIGPRSALFTPFERLGLVVIDEEHESSYKSDTMPKYHAREVAEKLCELHLASLILGSATPSLESYYRAKSGKYKLFTLDKRANEAELPQVEIIDLREELKAGNKTYFSRRLYELINDRLNKEEQVMLFLNRRGYSGFVSCRSCGEAIKCPHCDVSLSKHGKSSLLCHYCGYSTEMVSKCPECGSTMIGEMRAGTEKIEEMIKRTFPQANVLRMDADTTKQKDSYEKILSSFANKEADILIGTQMIVKGHDFPYVTLVGILAADMSLNVNDYRASERTFQLLTQASGRAGRGALKGNVIIQTYKPDHYSIVAASKQDYDEFYEEEICYRSLLNYPPVEYMLVILIESTDEELAISYSEKLSDYTKNDIIKDNAQIVGPTDASVRKIADVFRRVLYIKSSDKEYLIYIKNMVENYESEHKNRAIRISFDFNPQYGY